MFKLSELKSKFYKAAAPLVLAIMTSVPSMGQTVVGVAADDQNRVIFTTADSTKRIEINGDTTLLAVKPGTASFVDVAYDFNEDKVYALTDDAKIYELSGGQANFDQNTVTGSTKLKVTEGDKYVLSGGDVYDDIGLMVFVPGFDFNDFDVRSNIFGRVFALIEDNNLYRFVVGDPSPSTIAFEGGELVGYNLSNNNITFSQGTTVKLRDSNSGQVYNLGDLPSVPQDLQQLDNETGVWAVGQEALVTPTQPNVFLPVELLYFDVTKDTDGPITLRWETASERNSSHFIVQRSQDARIWDDLFRVDAQGNTNESTPYRETDESAIYGVYYYRLKMVDQDGTFEYSDADVIKIDKADHTVRLFPNPAPTDDVTIRAADIRAVHITDFNGRVFLSRDFNQTAGMPPVNDLPVNIGTWPAGTYHILIETSQSVETQKIVVY